MAKIAVFALLALAVAVSAGSLRLHGVAAPTQNIVQIAVATPDLSTLVTALTKASLVSALEGPGPFTVFAPTNEAFAKLPSTLLSCLINNPAQLSDILLYHVVSGHIDSGDLQPFQEVPTLDQKIKVAVHKNSNGVFVNNAKVIIADVEATNGVVHVIDTVLVPEQWEPCAAPSQNIVQLAQSNPALSTLVKAVVAAGLASALSAPGPFTVFAPTDEAFAAVPSAALNCLLGNVTQLQDVLTYHVAKGAVTSAELSDGELIPTLEGSNVTIHITQNVFVNNAKVLIPNVFASNGVVHVINQVIVPSDVKLPCLGL